MIRIMMMWLAGATFEVRLINVKTGKKIPGRLQCTGGYWKCRKTFKRKRLKYGYMLRLQAVSVMDYRINSDVENIRSRMQETAHRAAHSDQSVETAMPLPVMAEIGVVDASPEEIELAVHQCNEAGPMDWDFSADEYRPTCSVCGELQ